MQIYLKKNLSSKLQNSNIFGGGGNLNMPNLTKTSIFQSILGYFPPFFRVSPQKEQIFTEIFCAEMYFGKLKSLLREVSSVTQQ